METLLPIIDLFKKSFDLYIKKVWTLARIVLFGFLGLLILLPFGLVAFIISYAPFSAGNFSINLILIDILLALIGVFFTIFFGLWTQVATFCAVKENEINFKKALALAWPKMGSFFWISLLTALAIFAGFILLVIPGIIFAVWFCFSIFVFVAEDLRGTAALKKSKQLVRGYFWPVFGRMIVLGIVVSLISWIKFFGPIINIFFTAPFAIVFEYMLFEDLKRVKN